MQPPGKREACSVTLRAADLNYAIDDRSQPASMGISTLIQTILVRTKKRDQPKG